MGGERERSIVTQTHVVKSLGVVVLSKPVFFFIPKIRDQSANFWPDPGQPGRSEFVLRLCIEYCTGDKGRVVNRSTSIPSMKCQLEKQIPGSKDQG